MAKTDETPEKQPEASPPAAKGGITGLLLGAGLLLALMLGSASAAVVVASIALRPASDAKTAMTSAQGSQTDAPSQGAPLKDFTFKDPIIVNVYQTQQRRFLSVAPVFVMNGDKSLAAITERQNELKQILITILKSKTLDQLDDPQIANTLSREIQEAAAAKLNLDGALARVYFTQLVVQ